MKNRGQSLPIPHFGAGPTRPACYSPVCQFPRWLYRNDISDIDTTTLESDVNLEARNLLVSSRNCGTLDLSNVRPSDLRYRWGKSLKQWGKILRVTLGNGGRAAGCPACQWTPRARGLQGTNDGVGGARGRWRRSVETTGPTTMNPTRKVFSVPLYIGNMGGV